MVSASVAVVLDLPQRSKHLQHFGYAQVATLLSLVESAERIAGSLNRQSTRRSFLATWYVRSLYERRTMVHSLIQSTVGWSSLHLHIPQLSFFVTCILRVGSFSNLVRVVRGSLFIFVQPNIRRTFPGDDPQKRTNNDDNDDDGDEQYVASYGHQGKQLRVGGKHLGSMRAQYEQQPEEDSEEDESEGEGQPVVQSAGRGGGKQLRPSAGGGKYLRPPYVTFVAAVCLLTRISNRVSYKGYSNSRFPIHFL